MFLSFCVFSENNRCIHNPAHYLKWKHHHRCMIWLWIRLWNNLKASNTARENWHGNCTNSTLQSYDSWKYFYCRIKFFFSGTAVQNGWILYQNNQQESLRKRTKSPHQVIRWNHGVLCSEFKWSTPWFVSIPPRNHKCLSVKVCSKS